MAEGRVEYVVRLDSTYGQQNLKPQTMSDCFKIMVTAVHRDFSTNRGTMIPTCLFRTSILINCNDFFTQNQDFLWSNLQRFYLSPYFNYEDLALITRSLIPKVKEMFGFSDSFRLAIPNAGARVVDIPLVLNIISNVQQQNGERIIQERVEYVVRLDSTQQNLKPQTMSDCFKINVTAVHRDFSTNRGTMIPTCLFRTSILVNCNDFFTQNQYFLWSNLQGFYLTPYFKYEDLALITRNLIHKVKEMFGFSDSFRLAIPNAGARTVDIPLVLTIISKVQQQNGERMIPASNEVVSSLNDDCSICMERFNDDLEEDGASDKVKISTMVCGHIFHYSCIVKWVRTSPVCPLCRCAIAMPL